MPTTPHSAAGCRIEPPVSEPRAKRHSPAAVAAADPPEEPPGTRSRSQGLWVAKKAEFSVDEPIANSSMFDLPIMTTSCALSRSITLASYGGMKFSSMRDEQV